MLTFYIFIDYLFLFLRIFLGHQFSVVLCLIGFFNRTLYPHIVLSHLTNIINNRQFAFNKIHFMLLVLILESI